MTLPAAWLQPRKATCSTSSVMGFPLREVASRQRAGGLSRVAARPARGAGRQAQLAHVLVSIRLPEVISGSLLLVGCLIFAHGLAQPRASSLAYFGGC